MRDTTGIAEGERAGRGGKTVQAGSVAGTRNSEGYLQTSIDGRLCLVHRVVWAYMHGEWPQGQIDHIDGDRSNNRLLNLRDVSPRVNSQNQRQPQGKTASGFLGVSRCGRRWKAVIRSEDGKDMHLGVRDTPEEAHGLYVAAKREIHQGNTL